VVVEVIDSLETIEEVGRKKLKLMKSFVMV
jgi:hypothetical protein